MNTFLNKKKKSSFWVIRKKKNWFINIIDKS